MRIIRTSRANARAERAHVRRNRDSGDRGRREKSPAISLVSGHEVLRTAPRPVQDAPAKEDDPRPPQLQHLYYDQQDLLTNLARSKAWSILQRAPARDLGFALGNQLNIISRSYFVYATILREQGKPLTFPGMPGAFTSIYQATDAGLLARAMVWMATSPACADQSFNVHELVTSSATRICGRPSRATSAWSWAASRCSRRPCRRDGHDKEPLWAGINRKYGLKGHPISALANWNFGNYALLQRLGRDVLDHQAETVRLLRGDRLTKTM